MTASDLALASLVALRPDRIGTTCPAWIESAGRPCGHPQTIGLLCARHHKVAESRWADAVEREKADDGYIVLLLDGVASGAHWTTVEAKASTPLGRRLGGALAAYFASLPAAPKPGETWEIGTGADTHTAVVVEAPDGSACFVWHPHGDIAIRHVSRFEGCRRKIADAPSGADQ